MAEEIMEAVQIIRVAYEGIEIAIRIGSGGLNAAQRVVETLIGEKVKLVEGSYKNIKIANKTIILYNDVTLRVYTVKGKQKYEGNFDKGIVDVIMLDDKYNYLIIDPANVEKIKLK